MFNWSKKTIAVILSLWTLMVVMGTAMSIMLRYPGISAHGVAERSDLEENAFFERYSRLDEVYHRLKSEYYIEVDDETLLQGAIDGMLASLGDPYTFYFTPEEMAATREENIGIYEGVGMLVSADKQGRLTILRVFKDSPAQTGGLLAGDAIIEVNGNPISAETYEKMNEAVAQIKGERGTEVTLTIARKDSVFTVTLKRQSVVNNRVEYQILDGNIGYLVLYEFFGDAANGVREAYSAFEEQNVKGVILDVRNNPGGLLFTCLDICDMFLPEGLIIYIEDRYGDRDDYFSASGAFGLPLVVLINESSASASEIFAAAIQEYGMGTLVGETTYGKGIVQTDYEFASDGAGMRLTTSSYFTPSGRSIHKLGVTPDIVVEMSEDYDASIHVPDMQNDNQLKAAYDALIEQIAGQ